MIKDWFSQSAVWRFRPVHIDWVCEYYEVILEGRWPDKKTGYIDTPLDGRSPIKDHAYFESTINLLAEFHWRIDQCGDDGRLFRAFKLLKYDYSLVRSIMGRVDEDGLGRRCKRVTDYIKGIGKSGLDRRRQSYKDFCCHWSVGYKRMSR